MEAKGNGPRRAYNAPRRAAAAERTRQAIVAAAKESFEEGGWSGATIPAIAARAKVARQTVEAIFGTKATLLQAVVDFSIRGDLDPTPMPGRDVVAQMEAASEACLMLDLHASHLRSVHGRSARIASVVEHAALSARPVARLWAAMTENRRYAAAWAASTLLAKHDAPAGLERRDVEETFWVAIDWSTYRSLTDQRGLTSDEFEAWLRRYYARMLGA